MKKLFLIVALPFVIIFTAYVCFAIIKEVKTSKKLSSTPLKADDAYQRISGFVWEERDTGKKCVTVVKAEEVVIKPKMIGFFKTPFIKEVYMSAPQVIFTERNKEIAKITADTAKMDIANKRMVLKDGVQMSTANGKLLLSETMAFDPKAKLVFIKGKFKLIDGENKITGFGLKSDIGLKEPVFNPGQRRDIRRQ
ncbi:MAG: LPS export ABC transporter periplasmic protein LptC [Candidatus Omnitrophica bacterium]|nr:LPS export ABC transporter periplasmic protein LptC [Candidatus Omnitrophota bacterium]